MLLLSFSLFFLIKNIWTFVISEKRRKTWEKNKKDEKFEKVEKTQKIGKNIFVERARAARTRTRTRAQLDHQKQWVAIAPACDW